MKKVMIVGSDYIFRNLVRIRFEKEGLKVTEAMTKDEALKKCCFEFPDLILLDQRSSPDFGLGFVSEIANESGLEQKPTVVAISETVEKGLVETPAVKKEFKVNLLLGKPFNLDALVQEIKKVMED